MSLHVFPCLSMIFPCFPIWHVDLFVHFNILGHRGELWDYGHLWNVKARLIIKKLSHLRCYPSIRNPQGFSNFNLRLIVHTNSHIKGIDAWICSSNPPDNDTLFPIDSEMVGFPLRKISPNHLGFKPRDITIWLVNIAMENHHFE